VASGDSTFSIAAVQAAPVVLDREATVEKACALIAEASRNGARLIVFPESFIPAYPDWVWSLPAGEVAKYEALHDKMVANAVDVPGPTTQRLCQAAKKVGAYVVMGVTERNVEASGSSLYNTLVFIDDKGNVMGKHRKLIPTGGERLVWAPGDGSTLHVFDTALGKVGGLICWENYMPLARYAMYAWGTQIYLAPTWDRGESWLTAIRHIANEGRTYVVGCCQALRTDDIPDGLGLKESYPEELEWINVGNSAIVGPDGRFLAGPLEKEEGILYAEVDPAQMRASRWMFDVAGHYARPDVFQLTVHTDERPMISAAPATPEAPAGKKTRRK
jgi:nitrilase